MDTICSFRWDNFNFSVLNSEENWNCFRKSLILQNPRCTCRSAQNNNITIVSVRKVLSATQEPGQQRTSARHIQEWNTFINVNEHFIKQVLFNVLINKTGKDLQNSETYWMQSFLDIHSYAGGAQDDRDWTQVSRTQGKGPTCYTVAPVSKEGIRKSAQQTPNYCQCF